MGKTLTIHYSVTQTITLDEDIDIKKVNKWDLVELFVNVPFVVEDLDAAEPISITIHDENGKDIADWLL